MPSAVPDMAKLLLFIYYCFILYASSSSFPQNTERLVHDISTLNSKISWKCRIQYDLDLFILNIQLQ